MTEPDDFAGFNTPEHRAAQSGCHHFVHCAVDADTRRAISADLDNARATTPNLVPVYVAMLAGPCTLPPHDGDRTGPTTEDTIITDPSGSALPDDPVMLADIITHAGTLGEESDDTAEVRVFHNLDSRFGPYEPGHRLREVFTDTVRPKSAYDICEDIFHLLNVGDDPAFGTPDPRAVAYRRAGWRSLSVGDVVAVDGVFHAVLDGGFGRITGAPTIVTAADLTPGFAVTETATGRAIAPGDAVFNSSTGWRGRFIQALPGTGGAAVVVDGNQVPARYYGLTVKVLATETSITPLTRMQHNVIEEYLVRPHPNQVRLYKNSARFMMPPAAAVALVESELAKLVGTSGRSFPRQPLAAVLAKVKAELAAAIERGVA